MTTFLISLHKQIFCLPKDCTYKTCENIFKGQFVQSSDKRVYFSLDLITEWIIMSRELLYERTVVGGFELLASLCLSWSENRVSGYKSLGNRSSFRRDALQGTSLCGFPEWGLPLPSFQPALLLCWVCEQDSNSNNVLPTLGMHWYDGLRISNRKPVDHIVFSKWSPTIEDN